MPQGIRSLTKPYTANLPIFGARLCDTLDDEDPLPKKFQARDSIDRSRGFIAVDSYASSETRTRHLGRSAAPRQ
jgi:hypothetical protein